ncbi:hypothetical protein [Pedobacter frigidisoli]|uniref:hypothetical protein n=1 Tax=Pedobacter frigidisoli TaxID=2530455 RepID=UPI00293040BA|nr:hypothetical protein [Pedobacter frigidisoli]
MRFSQATFLLRLAVIFVFRKHPFKSTEVPGLLLNMLLLTLLILSGNNPASAQHFNRTPFIEPSGVMEVGRFFDFHDTNDGTSDYSLRMEVSDGKLYSSGLGVFPGLGINTISVNGNQMHIFGGYSSSTNLILSANYENAYRWKFRTTDRGNAIDLDIICTDNADREEQVLKLSPSFSGRPEMSVMNDWLTVNNANIGIGTSSPDVKLHLKGGSMMVGTNSVNNNNTDGYMSIGNILENSSPHAQNWHSSSTLLLNAQDFSTIGFHDSGLRVDFIRVGNGIMELGYDGGWGRPHIKLPNGIWDASGNVGIGLENPTERLTVNGKVKAREIRVDVQGMPDYVFKAGYQNMSLSETEAYIKKHQHLPEVPSATEAEQNGLELGEMNKLLLKKIEELTLHLIEKDKQLNRFEERLNELEGYQKKNEIKN